jgi:predicted thioesterase
MKSAPKIGTTGELQFVVEQKHVIDFATDGMPAVLSTPNLIGVLERIARKALEPFLDADERSVGIEIELRHFVPTPLGAQITSIARVFQVDGRKVSFQIEAREGNQLIARGLHKRAVVRVQSFANQVLKRNE